MAEDMRGEQRASGEPPAQAAAPSRRGFLVAGALGVVAAGGGVAVGLAGGTTADRPPPAPGRLLAAVAAERELIASIDAVRHPPTSLRSVLRQVRADHVAHLDALRAAVALAGSTIAPPRRASVAAPGRAGLRTMEQQAAARAAELAMQVNGSDAVLLASIAACEATHAQLLS